LSPARGVIRTGKFDQRARCAASSNANSRLLRCCWSSVARKRFAALTILAVGLAARVAVCCPVAVLALKHNAAATAMPRAALVDERITSSPPR
jgi:hypothetical protein